MHALPARAQTPPDMSEHSQMRILMLFTVVAVLAAGAGLWLGLRGDGQPAAPLDGPERDGPLTLLPEPRPLADFSLVDQHGRAFSRADLEGRWSLVFFGFASCPHICPDTLFQLQRAVNGLDPVGETERPRVVFVSVDPERDTPERLDEYVAQFGPDVIAITGEHPQLRALATQLGIHYNIPDHAPGEWYNVDHTVSVPVLDPQARWAGVLGAPHEAEGIRDALALRLVPGGNTRTGP